MERRTISVLLRKTIIFVLLNHLLLTIESHRLRASCIRFLSEK
jgi:hypothetical protein